MSNHPETVQIGPYTYQICYLEEGDPRLGESRDIAYDRRLLEIYIPDNITPQIQATWLLATVLEVTLRNIGVENYDDLSRELAYHLASTWGSSPNVVAFIEGGLLSRRPDWVAKLDDDGFEAAMAEADELLKEADKTSFVVNDCPTEPMFPKERGRPNEEPRCTIIGKQSDPSRPFYDQPTEPVDVECDTNHSPMDTTTPANAPKVKIEGYRTIELRPENGGKVGLISQADYSDIVNSGYDSFDYAYERGRLLYQDGKFTLAPEDGAVDITVFTPDGKVIDVLAKTSDHEKVKELRTNWTTLLKEGRAQVLNGTIALTKEPYHLPDAVRDFLDRCGVSVGQALSEGAVEIVNGVVQMTGRGNAFPYAEAPDEGPGWNIRTFACEKFIHFSDDEPDVYWSLENGRAGRVTEEENGWMKFDPLGVWADYHAAHPRITGEPVRDATGRQFQTVRDDLTRIRILPYGWHPPQPKG